MSKMKREREKNSPRNGVHYDLSMMFRVSGSTVAIYSSNLPLLFRHLLLFHFSFVVVFFLSAFVVVAAVAVFTSFFGSHAFLLAL